MWRRIAFVPVSFTLNRVHGNVLVKRDREYLVDVNLIFSAIDLTHIVVHVVGQVGEVKPQSELDVHP